MLSLSAQYLAGFFDGEGSVMIKHMIHKKCSTRFEIAVSLSNNDRRVLCVAKRRYGGCVCRNSPSRPNAAIWIAVARQALKFLYDVYPFLVIKANQAWLAICFGEYLSRLKRLHKWKRVTQDELELRMAAKELMMNMNTKKGKG